MNQVNLYLESNLQGKKRTERTVKDYGHLIQWRADGKDKLLDIGCGTGDVLVDNILPIMPNLPNSKVFGTDVSPTMIEHCVTEYRYKENMEFLVMDILKVDGFIKEHGTVDHVTSFYALHWLSDHDKCFKNIYKLLNPSGDFFGLIMVKNEIFNVSEIMVHSDRWFPFLKGNLNQVGPYHKSENPEKDVMLLMNAAGFVDVVVKTWTDTFTASEADFYNLVKTVRMEVNQIPNDLLEEFLKDYLQTGLEAGLLKRIDQDLYAMNYDMLFVHARKK